jgi:hypothetical protein
MFFVPGYSAEPELRPATTDQAKRGYQSPHLLKLSGAMLHQADNDNVPFMLMEDKELLGSFRAPKLSEATLCYLDSRSILEHSITST